MPNVSLPNPEMADSLPVSSITDWSAAFGFNNKDFTIDDDLGMYLCCIQFLHCSDISV